MRVLLRKTSMVPSAFSATIVIVSLVLLCGEVIANPPDTLSFQLEWVFPLKVVCMQLVDFDGDGVSEILVGYNSDSARVGILDAVSRSLRWQSRAFNGTIYAVAAGDIDNDNILDIICGGQRSDSSTGYIEVLRGPTFNSVDTASGFDEIVLSAAVSAPCPGSLPQIFMGTYYTDGYQSEEYPYIGWSKKDGRLFVLNGQNLSVEDVSAQGAIREISTYETDGETCQELLIGTDYFFSQWSEFPSDYMTLRSWVRVFCRDSSYSFYLHDIGYNPPGPYGIMFEALSVGSFDGDISFSVVGADWVKLTYWPIYTVSLASWNLSTTGLEWKIQSDYNADSYLKDLALCGLNSRQTNAICVAYKNGLLEFRSGYDGTLLAIAPRSYSINELELGNVDYDSLVEICVTSPESLYVYQSPSLTSVVDINHDNFNPESFHLFQNYPNPFNSETCIRFSVSHSTYISVSIYNILGKEIRTFKRYYQPGVHILTWDGRNTSGKDVASGIYLYRLTAGYHHDTKKMVLIR